MKFWDQKAHALGIDTADSDLCHARSDSPNFKVNLESFQDKRRYRRPAQTNLYTDGSKVGDQVGAGFAIFQRQKELASGRSQLPDYATVFQAEVTAIRLACEKLKALNVHTTYVKIFIDSQATLRALSKPAINSKCIKATISAVNQLAEQCRGVTLAWIRAHKGHPGNERADKLAKEGATNTDGSEITHCHRPQATIKREIKDHIYATWAQEWQTDPRARHTRSFYSTPSPRKAKYVYGLARLELGRLVRIITGHNNLNFFQTKIGLWGDPECRFCHEGPETITHLLAYCPLLTRTEEIRY